MEAIAALELCGTLTTLALICLAEGFHRQAYFGVALVCSVLVWIGGLVFVRFAGRLK
jgi:multisubunit Na+/H+ antiporter MnhF subunit